MIRQHEKLRQLEAVGRLRSLAPARGIDFTSNDYLGLSQHKALRETAIKALQDGLAIGATGSRLLRGNHPAHEALEDFAARYFGTEKALFFVTGFQANQALFTALPQRGDTILFDALIHASVREAIQHSTAAHIKVPHNNLQAFEDALKRAGAGAKWIAVESIYSMDGDCAPLSELAALASKYDATLIVDEAHGTGVFGPNGKGLSEGLPHTRLITLHTCGKALGVAGGLVCADTSTIDFLMNKARGFIYSTAPMPLQALLAQRALEIVAAEPERRTQLWALQKYAAEKIAPSESQIIPVVLGDDRRASAVAEALQTRGFDVRAIRPPTVPEGTARLRLSINLGLQKTDIDGLATALSEALQERAA